MTVVHACHRHREKRQTQKALRKETLTKRNTADLSLAGAGSSSSSYLAVGSWRAVVETHGGVLGRQTYSIRDDSVVDGRSGLPGMSCHAGPQRTIEDLEEAVFGILVVVYVAQYRRLMEVMGGRSQYI